MDAYEHIAAPQGDERLVGCGLNESTSLARLGLSSIMGNPNSDRGSVDQQPSVQPVAAFVGDAIDPLDALLNDQHPRKLAAKQWAREHLGSAPDVFDHARWSLAAQAGIQALVAPVDRGGLGRTLVEAMLTFEGLGAGSSDSGLIYALAAQTFAMQRALFSNGSDEQLNRWTPGLLAGNLIGSFAMSEPDAGSDIASIRMVATPTEGGYLLDGVKSWVTLGPLADVYIVFAATDPTKGRWGISAFLVEADRPGVGRGPAIDRMGLQGAPFGDVSFTAVEATSADLLGPVGAGASIFSAAVEAERALLYGPQLGATERILDQAITRAATRRSGDRTIGSYQAISHRLADLKLALEASRLLVYKAAMLADRGRPVTMAAALAKLQTSESAVASALDVMRVFGAEGYTQEAGFEAELRHAIAGLNYAGTSDIQRNVVAGLLGVDRPRR